MKYKAKNYRHYRIEGTFEMPRYFTAEALTMLLVIVIEKLGGFDAARFVECDEDGKAKHGKKE